MSQMNRSGTPPPYMSDSNEDKKHQDLEGSPTPRAASSARPAKKPNLYERICHNKPFQTSCRVGQCIVSIIGLILFAIRLHRIAQHAVDAVTASNGAVMGIYAAAVLYGIAGLIIRSALKNGGPMYLRFVWVVLDIAFVVAFIMVAELTAPGRGMTSSPCHTTTDFVSIQGTLVDIYNALNCKLPLGTFIMAIINVILHSLTAIFNQAKDAYNYYKGKRASTRTTGMPRAVSRCMKRNK